MMQVALVKYEAVAKDDLILKQIETSNDSSIKSRKVELALAALCSFNNSHIKKDIFSTPSFTDSVALIQRMSPGGKLSLARTLLEQISA